MISLKKIIHKLLLFFFVQLLIGNYSLAGSIPAFCMFNYGFFKNSQSWSNACKSVYKIYEYEYGDSTFYTKFYKLLDNKIYEYEYGDSTFYTKFYKLLNNKIYEYEYGDSTFYTKFYKLEK